VRKDKDPLSLNLSEQEIRRKRRTDIVEQRKLNKRNKAKGFRLGMK